MPSRRLPGIITGLSLSAAIALTLTAILAPVPTDAQQTTEEEVEFYRTVMTMTRSAEPSEVIAKCAEFLEKYPSSGGIPSLMRQMIPVAAQLDAQSPLILEYARLLRAGEGETPMAYNNAAWALFGVKAYLDTAAAWANVAIAGFPREDESPAGRSNRALVLDTVGQIAHARGQTEQAISLQGEAAELAAANAEYRVTLSRMLIDAGRWPEAERYTVDAILLNPRIANGSETFDEITAELAGVEAAVEGYRVSAIERGVERRLAATADSMLIEVKAALAAALSELDFLPELALSFAREVVAAEPENPSFKAILGLLLLEAEEYDEAEDLLVEARLLAPRDRQAQAAFDRLAQIRVAAGADFDTYRDTVYGRGLDRILSHIGDTRETKLQLATTLESLGVLTERALAMARDVVAETGLEAGPDEFLATRTLLAKLLLARGDYAEALDTLESARHLAPPFDAEYHGARGKALEELGRTEEAIEAYLTCATVYPIPTVMNPLRELWAEVRGEGANLDTVLAQRAAALEEWHPEGSYDVPSDWTGRTVLTELFTGSECPPCVAADIAFEYLLSYYPPQILAVLVYHEHIPGPDPMTNPDAEARMDYYNARERIIGGVPTAIINGTDAIVGGGGATIAKARYDRYAWSIENQAHEAPGLELLLESRFGGNRLDVIAGARITDPALRENENLRLRVALAERLIHHEGGNGITEHVMVVRQMLGGPDGFPLEVGGPRRSYATFLDIETRETELLEYLTDWETEHADRFYSSEGFTVKRHEIDESNLVLVAFVQDDDTHEILQAKVVEVR